LNDREQPILRLTVICNQKVVGSIPIAGTKKIKGLQRCNPFLVSGGLTLG